MNWIDQVKERVRIVEIVSRYCPLNSTKSRIIINCPFHSEKSPSLHIDTAKNMFHCFGCKAGGDPIKFIQLIERLTFIDACKLLADIYNIQQTKTQPNMDLLLLEKIVQFCIDQLQINNKINEYLLYRNLNKTTIVNFQIGWFPDQAKFRDFCRKEHVTDKQLSNIGINPYLFSNRIIFPIYSMGSVVGIGGRSLDSSVAKYVNTAESIYFKKKEILFGLNQIKSFAEQILLVEGYLDVCICKQYAIPSVSCLGTNVSIKQIQLLWEYTDEIIVAFDGDLAGRTACNKVAELCLSLIRPGKMISFIEMPDKEDPASYISTFENIYSLKQIQLIDKLWEIYSPNLVKSPELRVNQYHKLLAQASVIRDNDLRQLYINAWKNLWFKKTDREKSQIIKNYNAQNAQELILLALPFYYPNIIDYIWDYLSGIKFTAKFHKIQEILIQKPPIDFAHPVMLEFSVKLCPKQKLYDMLPFISLTSSIDQIAYHWLEVFKFYSEFACRTEMR